MSVYEWTFYLAYTKRSHANQTQISQYLNVRIVAAHLNDIDCIVYSHSLLEQHNQSLSVILSGLSFVRQLDTYYSDLIIGQL